MNVEFASNTLYYGDCLDVMSDFPDQCIDLIYLDPPFNSNQKYRAIFKASGLSVAPQLTLDPQTAQGRWRNTLEPIRMGQTTYRPIKCFSIKEYYQHDRQCEVLLHLPPLANPWTGTPVQRTLWNY